MKTKDVNPAKMPKKIQEAVTEMSPKELEMQKYLMSLEKYSDIIMDDSLKHALFCWNRMALFCKCWGNSKKKITFKAWEKTNPDWGTHLDHQRDGQK